MEINTLTILQPLICLHILVLEFGHGSAVETQDFIIQRNETCEKQQNNFALAAQRFTSCSILSARPITFCRSCVTSYLELLESHNDILKGQDGGVNCKEVLINMDRLEIIETLFTNFAQLWNKGECDYCFVANPNGTINPTPNNDTSTFQQLDSQVRKCVQQNIKNKTTVCTECLGPYTELNDFYNSLKKAEESGKVCMDIVDSMNASRMEWSKDLGCKYDSEADLRLILLASFVSFIPIVFYALVRKYSSKVESKLLHQSRLAEQLNSPSTSCVS